MRDIDYIFYNDIMNFKENVLVAGAYVLVDLILDISGIHVDIRTEISGDISYMLKGTFALII